MYSFARTAFSKIIPTGNQTVAANCATKTAQSYLASVLVCRDSFSKMYRARERVIFFSIQ